MHGSPLDEWLDARGARRLPDGIREPAQFGGIATEYEAVTRSVGLHDASAGRDRLLVSGDDRVEFLQGLCSNDVEKMPAGASLEAAFITPKGKLVADARVTKLDDAYLIDAEAGRAAALEDLLSRYRVHEKVEWADASPDLAALELWGPKSAAALGEETLADGASRAVVLGEDAVVAVGTLFGAILYVPGAASSAVAQLLSDRVAAAGGALVGRDAIEARRIELGLGRYGIDWDENTNPLEAGLDRTIDYKKGCYVGQEVVAKATYIGRVNRRLVRLAWDGDPVSPGTPLIGGRAPGRVTSSARVPGTARVVALGVVRRDAAAAGTHHKVGEGGPDAVVVSYPHGSCEKPL
jgi:folate-binding protein YgfZ